MLRPCRTFNCDWVVLQSTVIFVAFIRVVRLGGIVLLTFLAFSELLWIEFGMSGTCWWNSISPFSRLWWDPQFRTGIRWQELLLDGVQLPSRLVLTFVGGVILELAIAIHWFLWLPNAVWQAAVFSCRLVLRNWRLRIGKIGNVVTSIIVFAEQSLKTLFLIILKVSTAMLTASDEWVESVHMHISTLILIDLSYSESSSSAWMVMFSLKGNFVSTLSNILRSLWRWPDFIDLLDAVLFLKCSRLRFFNLGTFILFAFRFWFIPRLGLLQEHAAGNTGLRRTRLLSSGNDETRFVNANVVVWRRCFRDAQRTLRYLTSVHHLQFLSSSMPLITHVTSWSSANWLSNVFRNLFNE